jgi:hypothetical protein
VHCTLSDKYAENILISIIEMKLLFDKQGIPCPRKLTVTQSQYNELCRLTTLSDKVTDIFGFTIEVIE